uniref:Uncharacterized protein n=1 Tax=Oryza meridionalis TaxID=40149 RepID=A0A0E0FBR8_9ORYZ
MAIRKFMYENIQMIHKTKEAISNHCLDLQFWIPIPVCHALSFIVVILDQETMRKACSGSRWNKDITLWRQIIVNNPFLDRFFFHLFMCTWKNEELHLPAINDGDELRQFFFAKSTDVPTK